MTRRKLSESGRDFLGLWNQEFKNYPLTERLLEERLFSSSDLVEEASFALYEGEDLVAFLASKNGPEFDPTVKDVFFVSLLYVNPQYRGQGIGGELLDIVKSIAVKNKRKYLLTGCDYDNLFSGIFTDEAFSFFEKQGFRLFEKNFNLLRKTFNPLIDNRIKICADEEEKQKALVFIERNFHKRWYHELMDTDYKDLVLVKEEERIIGFARISVLSSKKLPNSLTFYSRYQNLGGLGPLGIDPAYQGRGFGKVLVENAVRLLFERGVSEVLVDWTEKIDFYKKSGFPEIVDRFSVMVLIL